jgi:hypothetical protein
VGLFRSTFAVGASESPIVVVRDRDPRALEQPPRREFGERRVTYVHATTPGVLPASPGYVFNLDRLDDVSRGLAARARDSGADVTVIVRRVDGSAGAELLESSWNVIPAYGDTEHIGRGTLRRTLHMVGHGTRVVARGFLLNSATAVAGARRGSTFLALLDEMSEQGRTGERVVAAVLAPQRTGSQWLRDAIGWTAGSKVQVFHEHGVPESGDAWAETRCLADALALERDRRRRARLRQAALRHLLLSAQRRYIFLTDRDPVDRLVSYFAKRQARWLRERLDASGQRFDDPTAIRRVFEPWFAAQVAHQTRWFRTTLAEPFGLHVQRAQPTSDGLLVAHNGPNTLVIVPIERLDALRNDIEEAYGRGACAALADNSAAARGDAPLVAAFRRQVPIPSATADALRSIPEIAYMRSLVSGRASNGLAG